MKTQEKLNMTMLCDFYELTMGNGYFQTGYKDRIVYFDVFFRKVPDGGGFAITAGLEQLIDYIENLHFSEEDIAYCGAAASSARNFWPISVTSVSPAISMPSPRARRYFPRSRWWWCAHLPSKPSSSRPSPC